MSGNPCKRCGRPIDNDDHQAWSSGIDYSCLTYDEKIAIEEKRRSSIEKQPVKRKSKE